MSTSTRSQLVNTELAKRSLQGTVGHVLMLAVTHIFAPNALGLPLGLVWGSFGAVLVVRLIAWRRSLAHPSARGNLGLLAFGSIGSSVLWGVSVARVEEHAGDVLPAIIYAIFLCGISTSSVEALAPDARLQRFALGGLTLPGVLCAIAGYAEPAFGVLNAILFIHTLLLGAVASRNYWRGVSVVDQLREAANVAERLREEVAQRLQLEVELKQAQRLEAIGRLAAGIAHEINTPLQFVADSCTFLAEGLPELEACVTDYQCLVEDLVHSRTTADEARVRVEQVESIRDMAFLRENLGAAVARSLEGLGRVKKIVRATKEFAAHRTQVKVPANLNSALETTLVVCHHETDSVADIEKDLGAIPTVLCHGDEINQVFLNIIVNAAHAIGDTNERGLITIKTWLAGTWVKIAVSDTGSGIPADVLDKIFDPFFTTKPVGQGSGQGLAIARSIIVQKHGGTLDVSSQLGVGTTFTIALPAA